MKNKNQTCPICPRGCSLSAPNCRRGEEYAKTGNMPTENERTHNHRHMEMPELENKNQQVIMQYLRHAGKVAFHGGVTQENAAEMFSALTDEETLQLANLLGKLSEHWEKIAPHKHHRH